jgi:hypothetical protein
MPWAHFPHSSNARSSITEDVRVAAAETSRSTENLVILFTDVNFGCAHTNVERQLFDLVLTLIT